MTTEQLKALRRDTDRAIELQRGQGISGAVNWADLHCVEAEWIVNDDGEEYAQVRIEEASETAVLFQRAVQIELERLGWPDVSIVTEW
jgi:hypothetical protein